MPATVPETSSEFHVVAGAFADAAERVLSEGGAARISSTDLERCITGAIKLYAAKAEAEDAFPPPVAGKGVTPTEVALVVSEMLRAADISLFDLAMWYRRGKP